MSFISITPTSMNERNKNVTKIPYSVKQNIKVCNLSTFKLTELYLSLLLEYVMFYIMCYELVLTNFLTVTSTYSCLFSLDLVTSIAELVTFLKQVSVLETVLNVPNKF